MSESPRALAAKIAENVDPWADVDAIIVANAYLDLTTHLGYRVRVENPEEDTDHVWVKFGADVWDAIEAAEEPAA